MGFRKFDRQSPLLKGNYNAAAEVRKASFAAWLKLHRKVRQENQPFTIISEEFLLRLQNVDRLKSFLDHIFDRVVIVAYIRNPLTRFPSSVDQRIRGGAPLFKLAKGRAAIPFVLPKLERYANTFGLENLVVRNFDMANLVGGTPQSDFSYVVSNIVGEALSLDTVKRMNESIPAAVAAYLLRLNESAALDGQELTRADWVSRRELIKAIRQDESLMTGPKLHLNDDALVAHISAVFEDEIAEINRKFLIGQTGIELSENCSSLKKTEFRKRLSDWVYSFEDYDKSLKLSCLSASLDETLWTSVEAYKMPYG